MYAREVEGQTLTLRVSGLLWGSSLVMEDKETGSLWSHLLGECREGKWKGKTLATLPSVMTTWAGFRESHPDGTVALLSRTAREYTRGAYGTGTRHVLGVVVEGRAYAWPLDRLAARPLLHTDLAGTPALVAFHHPSSTARLYDRTLDGRTLTFTSTDGRMTDDQTGSVWDPVRGRALQGPLAGKHLRPYPAMISFRAPWVAFHPDGTVFDRAP